jgi:hypothetical protein
METRTARAIGLGLIVLGLLQLILPGIGLVKDAYRRHQFNQRYEFIHFTDAQGKPLTEVEYQKARNPTFRACYRDRKTYQTHCPEG